MCCMLCELWMVISPLNEIFNWNDEKQHTHYFSFILSCISWNHQKTHCKRKSIFGFIDTIVSELTSNELIILFINNLIYSKTITLILKQRKKMLEIFCKIIAFRIESFSNVLIHLRCPFRLQLKCWEVIPSLSFSYCSVFRLLTSLSIPLTH